MTFKEDLGKKLLDIHKEELKHIYSVKSGLESKADNYIKLTGIVLGLFSTISAIFFVSSENINKPTVVPFLPFYFILAVATVIYMIKTIKSAVDVFKTMEYFRPAYIKTFLTEDVEITSENVKEVLNKDNESIISTLITTYSVAIEGNRENNSKLKDHINNCYSEFKMGLRLFTFSIAMLVLISILTNFA